MKYERDHRFKHWPGVLRGRADEDLALTFPPEFWDREVNPGDRRTLLVTPKVVKDFPLFSGVGYWSVRLGIIPDRLIDGHGALVHAKVLASYETADPASFQLEIKVSEVHEPMPPLKMPGR